MNTVLAEYVEESGSSKKKTKRTGRKLSVKSGGLANKNKKLKASKEKLTAAQQEELVLKYRLKARKLGRSILRKWHARLDLQEVDSIVDLSLCEAVKRFNPTKGASFMTFLYYHLRGNLIRSVTYAATANVVPGKEAEEDVKNNSSQQRSVSALEIAEALSGGERVLPDEVLLKKELVEMSKTACDRLDDLEREVITRIYLGGQQLMDIAKELGYSRCHISRVKKKALDSLYSDMKSHLDIDESSVKSPKANLALNRRPLLRRRSRNLVSGRKICIKKNQSSAVLTVVSAS